MAIILVTAATYYSTAFDATENPISENGIWVNGLADGGSWRNVQTGNGNAYGGDFVPDGSVYTDPVAHLSTAYRTFNPNQYAEGVVHRAGGYDPVASHEIELLLRWEITSGNIRGYELLWATDAPGTLAIVRWNGPVGNYTALASTAQGQAVDGDIVRFQIVGGDMDAYINDVLALSVTNTTYTDGQPGIGFWPRIGSTLESYGWKSFTADNL